MPHKVLMPRFGLGMATSARTPRVAAVLRTEDRVTPLELFFDLVFVFAFTQVTGMLGSNPTWSGLGEGVLGASAAPSVRRRLDA